MRYKQEVVRTTITKTYQGGSIKGVYVFYRGGQAYLRGFLNGEQIESPAPVSQSKLNKLFNTQGVSHV